MIVRLHSLSARAPAMTDLSAVAELLIACDLAENGIADPTEEDVRNAWQAPGFNLKTDAWVIVTHNGGRIVGYADVHYKAEGQYTTTLRVHPDYCGRGIGTLLIWLVEERARQLMSDLRSDLCVTLSTVVSSLNLKARQLLEREGYTLARRFWRLMIEMEDMPDNAVDDLYLRGKFKMDLVIDKDQLVGSTPFEKRTGIYTTRQYEVHEKVLRDGCTQEIENELNMHFATA
jgi:GNAT superfamily N-acetyltransferase